MMEAVMFAISKSCLFILSSLKKILILGILPAMNSTSEERAPYWTFTTYGRTFGWAWRVHFDGGYHDGLDKSNKQYVRCVRGGQ